MDKKVSICSDGTAHGTKAYCSCGVEIPKVIAVEIEKMEPESGHVVAHITLADVKLGR